MKKQNQLLKNNGILSPFDSIATAKKQFTKLSVNYLPVVENNHLLGVLSGRELDILENSSDNLNDYSYLLESFFSYEYDNWFDLLKNFIQNETDVLPILDKNHVFLGYCELKAVLEIFSETPFINTNGLVLTIEKEAKDFSLSQITQIVESNKTKLFGLFISNQTEKTTQLILKISTENTNEIIQTFRRYGYTIISEVVDDHYLEELKNRSEYLQKYLNL